MDCEKYDTADSNAYPYLNIRFTVFLREYFNDTEILYYLCSPYSLLMEVWQD